MGRWAARDLAGPLAGLAVGILIVVTYPTRSAHLWIVWAPIAVCLTAISGLVFSYGLRRWADLVAIQPMRGRTLIVPVLIGAVGALIVTNVTWLFGGDVHANWRNAVLTSFATVAAVPLATVINGIRHAAGTEEEPEPCTKGQQLARILSLRDLLQRSLAAGGAILTLVTLQYGSLWSLEHSVHSAFGDRPPQFILIFGGVGSLLLSLAYVPGWKSLQQYRARLDDLLFPMSSLDDATEVLNAAANRQRLQEILGLNSNVVVDMQSGAAILTPLLAGVAAAFLPH
jgi:hypothetical protein